MGVVFLCGGVWSWAGWWQGNWWRRVLCGVESGLQGVDLLVTGDGYGLQAVGEGAACVFEGEQCLLKGGILRGGSSESAGFGDTEKNVVEGFDVTVGGECVHFGVGRGVGGGEQRR